MPVLADRHFKPFANRFKIFIEHAPAMNMEPPVKINTKINDQARQKKYLRINGETFKKQKQHKS